MDPRLPGPVRVNDTVPPGADVVPEFVSVTVAVIVDVSPPAAILVGLAARAVLVVLVPTVTDPEPELVAWVLSDGVKVPDIDGLPLVVDVKVTVHDDALEFIEARVQGVVTLPGPAVVNATVPTGTDFVPPA